LSEPGETRPLAIVCGGGKFPIEVARAAAAAGRTPFLIGIVGAADPAIEAFAHVWLRIGHLGKLFSTLRAEGVVDVALIGGLTRPELADLRLDWGAIKRLPELALAFRGGDNRLLAGVAAIFEREGLNVVGAHEIAPQLLAPLGPIGGRAAAPQAEADISMGAALIAALSPFDAGQGVVIAKGRGVAVWRDPPRLRLSGPAGVFVKAPKRGQDLRLDMPAIGPQTIAAAAKAQLQGVAVAAGAVLIAEREAVARAADASGLFVAGYAP
jgi:DUF1009 family protein